MPKLTDTSIFRGGVTASSVARETDECTCEMSHDLKGSMDFRFDLASKGGGRTHVLVRVGLADFPAVITSIAEEFPVHSLNWFIEALQVAARASEDKVLKAQQRASGWADRLESVKTFVEEKCREAPFGADDREEALQESIQEILDGLRDMTE